ncbi:hypothetical protein AB7849_14100 [Rhodanobacter sp. 115]|uniref:hypothetical protein n=1 Tax=Rhodanobacter sp. FW021-MT20 TaxID=1162282 RepID=UPI0012F8ADD4|nr:hypothetical protein [Rhodanobacter sp. 115]
MRRTRNPQRRTIDGQRVRVWYGWLCRFSGSLTAYRLEKQLVPEGFARAADGTLSHRNRMIRYRDGKHVPRPTLVERAEALFPGGRALLEHPYWEILDPDRNVSACADEWLARLGVDVQRILFMPRRSVVDFRPARRTLTSVPLRYLEDLGTFEALAATALLVREALHAGDARCARRCAVTFWRLLLVISSSLPFYDVLLNMAKLADEALLHRVVYRGEQVSLTSVAIWNYETVLDRYCLVQQMDSTLKPGHVSWVKARLSMIRGDKGIDLQWAFRLPVVATSALQADPERHARYLREQTVRQMAFDYCSTDLWQRRSFVDDMMAFFKDPEGRWPCGRYGFGPPSVVRLIGMSGP